MHLVGQRSDLRRRDCDGEFGIGRMERSRKCLALQGEGRVGRGCCGTAILWISYVSGVEGVCVYEKYMFNGVMVALCRNKAEARQEEGL